MNTVPPRYVAPSTAKRDALIAVAAGLLVLAFVVIGIMQMGKSTRGNQLTGVIVGKEFTPLKERQVEFSGRQLKAAREIDREYVLKVQVSKASRVYEVPVEKDEYLAKKVGDQMTFMRPASEQE